MFLTHSPQDTFVLPAMENVVMPGMSRNMSRDLVIKNTVPDTLDVTQLLDQVPGENELLDVATSGGSSRSRSSSMRNSPVG